MEYITIQNTDLRVSRLCMGGCPMGGYGWGYVQEQELIRAVHTALDLGINFFDTADVYGLGTSERILGTSLGSRRADAVIATKFGVRTENGRTWYDNSPQWILHSCEESLRRLGTDYIDLYQIHYLDKRTDIHRIVDTLMQLQLQGRIRWFGLFNISTKDLDTLSEFRGCFASVQNQYSLACRDQEQTIQTLQNNLSVTPLTWGSLGQGILTGKYDKHTVFSCDDRRSRSAYVNFHGEKLLHNLEIVEALKQISLYRDKPVSAVAIRFILDRLCESAVLCGIKRPDQLLCNAEALDWHLTEEEMQLLDSVSKYQPKEE